MSQAVIKDCGDIWNRLFDHRPFLSSEIKFFIREFEETRGDKEVERLSEATEWLSEIRDTQIPKVSSFTSDLAKVNTLLDIALQTSNTILENEENFDVEEALKAKRAFRKTELESFNNDLKEKYAKINKTFSDQEADLHKFYEDLEKNLSLN